MKENRQNIQIINCTPDVKQISVQADTILFSDIRTKTIKVSRNKIFSTGAIQYVGGFAFLYTEVNQTFQMSK
jgi:hypothetical protein